MPAISGWSQEVIKGPKQHHQQQTPEPDSIREEASHASERPENATTHGASGSRMGHKVATVGRLPKVTGSFDHAILPMPPVSLLISDKFTLLIWSRGELSSLQWTFCHVMLLQSMK